ncbi:hypothetical protein BD779DRAFT_478148 [Infundibulicybe gibba]|nr:hypothetical protein BD779DRAFT_478148 [Infundibulicybe gibba]
MSHRLREIHFCCNTHIMQPFFALPPGSIDFLEIFDFRTPSCVSSPMPNLPVKSAPVFESAPRLRKAILTSSDAWTARIDFRIFLSSNLSQLTDVHCVGVFMPSSMCRKILLQCTRLRHCTLGISFENDPQHANQPSIIAADLTSFVLHIRCVLDGGASFLQSLAFPRLQSLEIRAQECRQPWPLQNLISLHSRSLFHLQSLGLWLWVTPEIETILEHFPALIEMDMNLAGESLGSSVLRRIGSGELVPHLESISCSVTGSTSFVRLFEMMELKRGDACTPPVAQLKTAYLRMSTHLTKEQRRRIIVLQNMGLISSSFLNENAFV